MRPATSGSSTPSAAAEGAPSGIRAATRAVAVGPLVIGGGHPLALLAGPCAIQDEAHALRTAEALVGIAADAGVPLVYKSSYDKANRSSVRSYRGPGLREGLRILRRVRQRSSERLDLGGGHQPAVDELSGELFERNGHT